MNNSYLKLLIGLAAFATLGHATTIYSISSSGASGTAAFTFGTNSLTVVLTDTVTNPGNVGLNLSALSFTFAGATGSSLTGASSPASRTVKADGTFSDAAGPTTVAGVGWVYSKSSNTYLLDVLSGTGHAGPANTLIGSPDGSNVYSAANSSITGNAPHNPFLASSATFNFTFTSGVDANTLLSGVRFQFGTEDNTLSAGTCQSGCTVNQTTTTPEPGAILLTTSGFAGLLFFARRRRRA
jgi:hypothetical protein